MTVVINGTTGIDTGTGSLIAADSTTATYLDMFEDTDNGSNYVRLIAPASIASNKTITLPDETGTVITSGGSGVVSQTMLATLVVPIGVGQSWSNVTGSRSAGTTYTNSTGKPIQVAILSNQGTNTQFQFSINGTLVWNQFSSTIYGDNVSCNFIIPNGATYSLTVPYGTIQYWMELR
jgi:hypothetical protein